MIVAMLTPLSNASYVNIIQPFNTTIRTQNTTVHLGKDGPGQTFYITISAATTNSTGALNSLGWNRFAVSGLPQGWIAQNSSLYNPTLSVKITPAPYAQNGTYSFNLTAINIGNYSKLGALRFSATVNITPDVFILGVKPATVSSGAGLPQNIYVTINNTGVSDSLFSIGLSGMPGRNITNTVIALHNTSRTYTYPIEVSEPGRYVINIDVRSISSPMRVFKETNVTFIALANLPSDYSAIGSGIDAFPIVYEPLYAIMYLISKLFTH